MPAKSKAQQRFMAACANNPESMKGKCPPKKVAKEFSHKPKGGKLKEKAKGKSLGK